VYKILIYVLEKKRPVGMSGGVDGRIILKLILIK
jgi:hypothetical protein